MYGNDYCFPISVEIPVVAKELYMVETWLAWLACACISKKLLDNQNDEDLYNSNNHNVYHAVGNYDVLRTGPRA